MFCGYFQNKTSPENRIKIHTDIHRTTAATKPYCSQTSHDNNSTATKIFLINAWQSALEIEAKIQPNGQKPSSNHSYS